MKKIIFVLFVMSFMVSCKCDKHDEIKGCSTISSAQDTLVVGNYKLFLISQINAQATGSLEVVDKNNNNINGSSDFSIDFVQLNNGSNCWETSSVTKATGISMVVYSGTYSGIPDWAVNNNTVVTIKLTISGNSYYLRDKNVNQ